MKCNYTGNDCEDGETLTPAQCNERCWIVLEIEAKRGEDK